RKAGRCVLEGEHIVAAYCRRHGAAETLLIAETALDRPAIQALQATVPAAQTLIVAPAAWADFSQLPAAVGALAVVATPTRSFERAADFCVLLEDVQDPGNVGSILRSAAAAGVAQVFLSAQCAFAWSPKVLRAAQGAHFHLEIYEDVDLPAWAKSYRGTVAAAVAAGGKALYAADLTGPLALAIAIGNEGAGLSAALRAAASIEVTIPMPGDFESLNAAAAAAVVLFECVRQRRERSPQHR
ncbi:MAG TPA: RNA methyltransferase, partial [Casimicrobiaceae bacterium]|nr:RNA methyltransferase [Casimicrobiaceae bacterium]